MLKGGGTEKVWVVFLWKLQVLAILNGGRKKLPPFKTWGTDTFYIVLREAGGGGCSQTVLDTRFSNFVSPPHPLPVINDQSLTSFFQCNK